MIGSTLACGPYFRDDALWMSLIIFLAVKPVAYFLFIQAFRFRVSRPAPLRYSQVFKLVLLRTGLGLVFVGGGAALLWFTGKDHLMIASWVYLYAARLAAWWIVGRYGAVLRGRRLIGWTISGTLMNLAFDVATVGGAFAGWLFPLVIMAVVASGIGLLDMIGRRSALRVRFRDDVCSTCAYDLSGNVSGRCPECGAYADPILAAHEGADRC
ncbi:MAG: hypothetical protein GY715_05455 [Planctomycetes bacterium]|nr:hypothetical protein [Planctomycetota bacterium]